MQTLSTLRASVHRRGFVLRIALAQACCLTSMALFAQQAPTLPPAGESGFGQNIGRGFADSDDPFDEPSFDLESDTDTLRQTPQVLPKRPPPSSTAESPLSEPVQVTNIVVMGNTILPEADIAQVVAPFKNRELRSEHIQELRRRLSLLYFNAGFINSGVLIPEQDYTNGDLKLQVIEGELQAIQLIDNEGLTREYLEPRIRRGISTPLNLNDLQNSLRLLELNPLIRQVNAVLVPGVSPGEADLKLRIKEEKPVRISVSADNYRSPSVGAERGLVTFEHLNLTGRGDRFGLAVSASDGLKDAFLSYQLPLNRYDSLLDVQYQRGKSEVVESPFDDLDIEGDSESWGATLSHPFINTLSRKFVVSAGLNHSANETSLLGEPFSFSLGARRGEISATSVSLGAQWLERDDNQVFAFGTTIRYGIDAFNATSIPDGAPKRQFTTNAEIPDTRFTAVLTQFQYARRLTYRNSQLVFSTVWQESLDPLLAVEKLAVGGVYSVRGFRENQLVRDNGLSASLEWRVPIFVNEAGYSRWNLSAVPFLDYGRSWDEDSNLSTHKAAQISSLGLGLKWLPIKNLTASLVYGYRIDEDDVPEPANDDLQDHGIHFSVKYTHSF